MARKAKAEAATTREVLLDAAETVFLEKGVARTSLELIARHAGMTRGAVYWHFKNKADLFQAMLNRVRMPFQELIDEIGDPKLTECPLEAIKLACLEAFQRLERPRYRRVYAILMYRCEVFGDIDPLAMQSELASDTLNALQKYLTCAAELGQLTDGLGPETAAELMHAMLSGLFHDWLRNHESFSLATKGGKLVETQLALMSVSSGRLY